MSSRAESNLLATQIFLSLIFLSPATEPTVAVARYRNAAYAVPQTTCCSPFRLHHTLSS